MCYLATSICILPESWAYLVLRKEIVIGASIVVRMKAFQPEVIRTKVFSPLLKTNVDRPKVFRPLLYKTKCRSTKISSTRILKTVIHPKLIIKMEFS